jgi:dihydrofolate reductase
MSSRRHRLRPIGMNTDKHLRRVVGNISLSLDGRTTGTGGDYDMGWIVPHAVTDVGRDHMIRVTGPATTALLGRKNYQGFGSYWPAVAGDPDADPRDRAFSAWLSRTEKVVFSTTLTEPTWENSRIVADDLPAEVRKLREQDGGDIVVLSSGSIIRALLAADLLDRLSITLCPALVGGGARLLEDGLPASTWTLADTTTSGSGAICLLYDRVSS